MNSYRTNRTPWHEGADPQGRSPAVWSTVTNFFRRQPEFVLGGALVGGALLAYWVNYGSRTAESGNAVNAGRTGYAPTPSLASHSTDQRGGRREERRSWSRRPEEPWRMPSARLGATEDQMEDLATPSSRALESGTPGATGAAYDLDPNSITGG